MWSVLKEDINLRTLVRGSTSSECKDKVKRMKGRGWTDISGIKVDDSDLFGRIEYVCVMERTDDEKITNKKNTWNRGMGGV